MMIILTTDTGKMMAEFFGRVLSSVVRQGRGTQLLCPPSIIIILQRLILSLSLTRGSCMNVHDLKGFMFKQIEGDQG
jgi:hypothetical protein